MSRFDPQPPLNSEIPAAPDKTTTLVPRETRDGQGQKVEYFEEEVVQEGELVAIKDEVNWLELARQSYDSSTDFLKSDMYAQWERNSANFRSTHPQGSKYHSSAYKYRSKMFRPKSRTAVRKVEAAMISALFGNQDLISVDAQNQSDPQQLASAAINKQLVQERVSNGSIPWYKLAVGGTQDASIYGTVISYQSWTYEEDEQGTDRRRG